MITWAELGALGMTPTEVRRRCEAGRLHRLHRGVYLWGNPSPAPFATSLAAVCACEPDAYLTAGSACATYAMIKTYPDKPQVLLVGRKSRREEIETRSTASLHRDDRRTWQAIPIVSPAHAVVDYARDATPDQVADAVEQGQIKRLLTKQSLQAAVDRVPGRPGTRLLKELLADLVFTRSKAERIVLGLIRQAGLPMPLVNEDHGDDEIDFVWRELRLALEVDGYRFHHTGRRVENDRRRDADRQRDGFTTLRATYIEITTRPHAFVARLAMAIARAQDALELRRAAA